MQILYVYLCILQNGIVSVRYVASYNRIWFFFLNMLFSVCSLPRRYWFVNSLSFRWQKSEKIKHCKQLSSKVKKEISYTFGVSFVIQEILCDESLEDFEQLSSNEELKFFNQPKSRSGADHLSVCFARTLWILHKIRPRK